jgi:hypothetical protein
MSTPTTLDIVATNDLVQTITTFRMWSRSSEDGFRSYRLRFR